MKCTVQGQALGVQREPEPHAERDGPGVFAEEELGSQGRAGSGPLLGGQESPAPGCKGLGEAMNASPKP